MPSRPCPSSHDGHILAELEQNGNRDSALTPCFLWRHDVIHSQVELRQPVKPRAVSECRQRSEYHPDRLDESWPPRSRRCRDRRHAPVYMRGAWCRASSGLRASESVSDAQSAFDRVENHYPAQSAGCATPFEMWDRQSGHSAHFVLDLERAAGGIRIGCVLHRYHALECACSVRTAARPGVGVLSTVPGRSRDLLMSEACLVGPVLATFIAALSIRYHVSRAKIREFLAVWFGVPLS